MKLFRFLSLGTLALFAFSMLAPMPFVSPTTNTSPWWMTVRADDHEDEDEEEEEDDEDEDEDEEEEETKSSKPKTIKVIKQVVEYKPVTETVVVTEEAYAKDTDGDLLVDALDPDPRIAQSEYFTDTDDDGVPNAIDHYPDEDDFAYYEMETDDNGNGILDSYEPL